MYENGSSSTVFVDSIDNSDFTEDISVGMGESAGTSEPFEGFPYGVSGNDAFYPYLSFAQISVDDVDPSVQLLQAIDYKLSILLFFLLASWTFARIRNAVRSFTGRSVDISERR